MLSLLLCVVRWVQLILWSYEGGCGTQEEGVREWVDPAGPFMHRSRAGLFKVVPFWDQ